MQLATYNTLMRHMRGATTVINLVVESERILTHALKNFTKTYGLADVPPIESISAAKKGTPVLLFRSDLIRQFYLDPAFLEGVGSNVKSAIDQFTKECAKTAVQAMLNLPRLVTDLAVAGSNAYPVLVLQDQTDNCGNLSPVMRRLLIGHGNAGTEATVLLVTDSPVQDVVLRAYMPVVVAERPDVAELADTLLHVIEDDNGARGSDSSDKKDRTYSFSVSRGKDEITDEKAGATALARSLAGLDTPMAVTLFQMHIESQFEKAEIIEQEDGTKKAHLKFNAEILANEKAAILNKEGYLTLFNDVPSEDRVGGLVELKRWIRTRRHGFSEEARAQKLPAPRGIMLVGPPGTAKSLCSKVIAGIFNVPLIRLDIGALFNSHLGSSERNMRTALSIADASAPCVLWLDEIR